MKKPFDTKEAGMYVGEVVIGVREMGEAIDAAQRLLGHAYDKVVFNTPEGEGPNQHEGMMRDIYDVAKMLLLVSKAITDARLVAGSNNEIH